MNFQILGISHKTAPIQLRERISFSDENICLALKTLKNLNSIKECVILSTCNRMEIYAMVKDISAGFKDMQNFICDFHSIQEEEIKNHVYVYVNLEAVRHLFRVASSLDSMVIGEPQILGQVRDAYNKARECKSIGENLERFFKEAIRVGKMVRLQTKIGYGAVSVGSVAVQLADRIFKNFKGKKVLIIGTGKIGELIIKKLHSNGLNTILVTNRTFEKALQLAENFDGKAVRFEEIAHAIIEADILINSTGASDFIIKKEEIKQIMHQRNYRPLFLIDLSVPRNIDPQVAEIKNVHLYNIDDLTQIVDENLNIRLKEVNKAEQIIQKELLPFSLMPV